eukprot:954913-Pyramimonas_sp.AAC.1
MGPPPQRRQHRPPAGAHPGSSQSGAPRPRLPGAAAESERNIGLPGGGRAARLGGAVQHGHPRPGPYGG